MVRMHYMDIQSSREFIDEKGVRLHNGNVDYRNASRGRVTVREETRENLRSSHSPVPSDRGHSRGGAHSPSPYPTPYVKSPASRKIAAHLRVQVDATATAAAGGGSPRGAGAASGGSTLDAHLANNNRGATDKQGQGQGQGGVDWSRPPPLSHFGYVDLDATLSNIRKLRQVSGNGMSLGHLQDNLVSKLQEIYRTHDDAIRMLEDVERNSEEADYRVEGALAQGQGQGGRGEEQQPGYRHKVREEDHHQARSPPRSCCPMAHLRQRPS